MKKINYYLFNLANKYILLNALLIAILILFINSIEITKLIETKNLSISTFIYLSFLKLPSIISETIPFIIIIAISFLYKNLISNNELISMRNMGLSILDIFKPVSVSILIFGIIVLVVLNPLAANFDNKFNEITNKKSTDIYTIKFINDGLWIKNNINKNDKRFINIPKFNLNTMEAKKIKILQIEKGVINLISSKKGYLNKNEFKLNQVKISNINTNTFQIYDNYTIKLNFNEKNIIDSVIDYKLIPFYKYKQHINSLKRFNLYSPEIALFYLSEIIKPLFLVIIGFVVMGYSGKFKRNESFFKVLFISVLVGFIFFLLKEIVINLTAKLNINFIISYFIILMTPLIIGLYQMIQIETE